MEIHVYIHADEHLSKLIDVLASAVSYNSKNVTSVQTITNKVDQKPEKEEDTNKPNTKAAEEKVADKQKSEQKTEKKTETKTETENVDSDEPTHNITIEEVRAVAAKLSKAGHQKELKAIFQQFNDEVGEPAGKLSAIQEADYPQLIEKIKAALGEE